MIYVDGVSSYFGRDFINGKKKTTAAMTLTNINIFITLYFPMTSLWSE